MIYRVFKSYHPSAILLILLLSVLMWFYRFNHPEALSYPFAVYEMPLFFLLEKALMQYPLVGVLVPFFLLLIMAFLINRMNQQFILLQDRSYLPALFFVLITSAYLPLQRLTPQLLAVFFMILGVTRVFRTYRNDSQWLRFFDGGLLISIGSLFDINMAYYLLVIWIAFFILRPFRGKEWLVSILGFILPYFFVGGYFYVFEGNLSYKINSFITHLISPLPWPQLPVAYWLYAFILVILIIVSSYHMIMVFQTRKVRVRKYFQIFFWLFFISLLLFVFRRISLAEFIMIGSVPVSYLFSNYFTSLRSRSLGEIFITLILLAIVIIQVLQLNLFPFLEEYSGL